MFGHTTFSGAPFGGEELIGVVEDWSEARTYVVTSENRSLTIESESRMIGGIQ